MSMQVRETRQILREGDPLWVEKEACTKIAKQIVPRASRILDSTIVHWGFLIE
jgi:uncharacterized protein with ATP-grasp and redox domains